MPTTTQPRQQPRAISPAVAWGIALVTIAALWASITWWNVADYRQAVVNAYDDTEVKANELANRTARTLDQVSERLLMVRYLIERDGAVDLSALAASGLLGRPEEITVVIVDAEGRLVQSSKPTANRALSFADRDYFPAARESEGVVYGTPAVGRIANRWVLPAALKIHGADGGFAGVVLIGLDAEALTRGYALGGDPGTIVSIIRRDGISVSGMLDGKQSFGVRLTPKKTAELFRDKDERGPIKGVVDGKPRFPTRIAIAGTDLYAIVSTTAATRLAPHVALRDTLLSTGAAMSLVIVIVTLLMTRQAARKRAAEARRQTLDRQHAAVLNAIPAQIALLTSEGRIIGFNDDWATNPDIVGISGREAALGEAFLTVCQQAFVGSTETLASIEATLRDVGSGKLDRHSIEFERATRGDEAWLRLTMVAAVVDDERHIVVVQWDISERKLAEKALMRSMGLTRIAGEVARIGGWVFDARTRRITLSEEFKTLLDLTEETTIGLRRSAELYPEESRERARVAFQQCQFEGVPFDIEVELVSARGRRFWARSIGHPVLDATGAVTMIQGAMQDVTERKRADLEAAAARAQLGLALDSMTDAFCIVDRDWNFTYVNPETEWLLRASKADLLGSSFWLALPSESRQAIEQQMRVSVIEGGSLDVQPFVSPAGAWCETRAYPCESGVAIYMRDTTMERRSQQHLRLMEACIARMNDMVLITDLGGDGFEDRRVVFVNEAFVNRSGYSAAELLGAPPSLLHGEATDPRALARIAEAIHNRTPIREELINYTKTGEKFWMELSIVPVLDEFGQATHVVAVGRDVTQNKDVLDLLASANRDLEAKVAARTAQLAITNASVVEKEQEIRSVVEHMADCVVSVDHQGQIRSANPMVETLFGYSPQALVGLSLSVLIPGLAEKIVLEAMTAEPERNDAAAGWTGIHRNGEQIAIEVSLGEYAFKEQRRVTAIVRDVRERLRALAELKQAQIRAEEASNAKSLFVATMSHEIRTPMSGVIGMIDLLRGTPLDIDQSHLVEMARESADSLMDIVESVLDFSKIEAGKVEVEKAGMSLHDVVERTVDLAHTIADRQGVEMSLFIDPGLPDRVRSDAVKLRQILLNLLSNAVKFSANREMRGRVSLRVSPATPIGTDARVVFAVADNGIGMDRPTVERLFTSFTQADASTTRRFGGTGLGLTIARELAHLLGGEIEVASEPGIGSTFRLVLPLERSEPVPGVGETFDVACHCLVIGDPSAFMADLDVYLRNSGCTTRATGASALDEQNEQPAEACVFVGGGDGDTVKRIRASCGPHLRTRPWIAILDHGPREPRVHADGVVILRRATLTRRRLQSALTIAMNPASAPEVDAVPAPGESRLLPNVLPVLVAEDNEINRHVIQAQLSRLGYRVHLASDGIRALDLLASGDYSMVFTDLRMPKLDGFGLVKAIRAGESGGRRIPVIALTANALKDESERCLAAGMDAYASKPLAIGALERLLEKWLPATSADGSAAGIDRGSPLDFDVITMTIGDDRSTLEDFLGRFKVAAKGFEGTILNACRRAQWAEAGDLAHQLKSNARTFGATDLGRICADLEAAADGAEVARIGSLLPELRLSVKEIVAFIDRWSATVPAPLEASAVS